MNRKLLAVAALILFTGPMSAGAASIVYDVNRTIGAGTVSGFIQTDGTLGVLTSSSSITDWSLTLAAPTLFGGTPSVISFATGSASLSGLAVTATVNQLLFDFGNTGLFLFQAATSPFNFWCLETLNVTCTSLGAGEHMGQGSPLVALSTPRVGSIVVGTVGATSVAPVPEPEIYAMMGLGLGLLGWIGRRKRRSDAAAP